MPYLEFVAVRVDAGVELEGDLGDEAVAGRGGSIRGALS